MLVYFPLFSSCGDEETGSHPLPGRDACAPSRCKTVRRSQELRHELTGSAGRARCLLDPAQLGVSVMQSFDRRQVRTYPPCESKLHRVEPGSGSFLPLGHLRQCDRQCRPTQGFHQGRVLRIEGAGLVHD